jgi:hypothetical protein
LALTTSLSGRNRKSGSSSAGNGDDVGRRAGNRDGSGTISGDATGRVRVASVCGSCADSRNRSTWARSNGLIDGLSVSASAGAGNLGGKMGGASAGAHGESENLRSNVGGSLISA